MTDQINQLIAVWNTETGQDLQPRAFERIAFEFIQVGFTAEDLSTVLKFKRQQQKRWSGGASFRMNAFKIMGNTEVFAADVSEARAHYRNRKVTTPRQDVLNATGRTETRTENTAVKIRGILKAL